MKDKVSTFVENLKKEFGDSLKVSISEPYYPNGIWFIDITLNDTWIVVELSKIDLIGYSVNPDKSDMGFTHKPDCLVESMEILEGQCKVVLKKEQNEEVKN